MPDPRLPGPENAATLRQHECARPEKARALMQAIPARPEVLRSLHKRHALSIKNFSADILRQLFRAAAEYECGANSGICAQGKVLSNIYFDHSRQHTRLSCNAAWLRLGGNLLDFERSLDEILNKRHAPAEIAEVCSNYSDGAVLRPQEAESFAELVRYFRIPVINAGNGPDEHPTQAMADLYTLFKWRPELLSEETSAEPRLRISIAGDPSHTRTIRSLLFGLAQFPQAIEKITFFGHVINRLADDQRHHLEQAGLQLEFASALYPAETTVGAARLLLPRSDVVYIHYLHPVHASRMDMIDAVEHMRENTLVLNPQVQDEKFPEMLNDSTNNGYFAQSRGSVFVRMALFAAILGTV